MEAYDPEEHARALYRETIWLRELLTSVAQELERLAGHRPEGDRERDALLARAQLVRKRLFDGPPERSSVA